MFVKFSLHHKWNNAQLLFIKMEYTFASSVQTIFPEKPM